jgi:ArsR family transcriptional regulator, zinc-responsive transcriptional repressor
MAKPSQSVTSSPASSRAAVRRDAQSKEPPAARASELAATGKALPAGDAVRGTRRMMSAAAFEQAAECLKALAHPHRLQMIERMLTGRYTVGELAEFCSLPSAMTSEHLRLLQRCGFLTSQRDGRFVYYQVAELHLAGLMECITSRFGQPAE